MTNTARTLRVYSNDSVAVQPVTQIKVNKDDSNLIKIEFAGSDVLQVVSMEKHKSKSEIKQIEKSMIKGYMRLLSNFK